MRAVTIDVTKQLLLEELDRMRKKLEYLQKERNWLSENLSRIDEEIEEQKERLRLVNDAIEDAQRK